MPFSESTNKTGIVEATRDYVSADSTAYPINELTRNVNKYYKQIANIIQECDGSWQWDDNNYTTLPIETTNLVQDQKDYTLSDDTRDITGVEVLDETGEVWRKLRKLDRQAMTTSAEEVFDESSQPLYFEQFGDVLYLYPAANYSESGGLKIYTKRLNKLFVYTDTTKKPGFDEQFHDYLAIGAGYEYARSKKGLTNLAESLYRDLKDMESKIRRFYTQRGGLKSMRMPKRLRI